MVEPEPGGLQSTTPGSKPPEKTKKVRGVVYVNTNRCKGCGFCIAFCPPKVLEFSDEFNSQGYHPPRLVHPDGCTGCDLCGLYCPDFAIFGVMLKYSPQVPAAVPGLANAEAPAIEQEGAAR